MRHAMLTKKAVSLAAVCCMVFSACTVTAFASDTAASQNLVKNGNFAQGLQEWTVDSRCHGDMVSIHPPITEEGPYSLVLDRSEDKNSYAMVTQQVSITQSGKYELSAFGEYFSVEKGGLTIGIKTAKDTLTKAVPIEAKPGEGVESALSFLVTSPVTVTVEMNVAQNQIGLLSNVRLVKKGDTPPTATNLLQNEGFERVGIPNWMQRGSNPVVMLTTAQPHTGAYSLYMGYYKSEGMNNYIDQTCAVQSYGYYKFSAYVRTDPMLMGAGAMLTLEARDANGMLLSSGTSSALSNTNGGWQQLSMQLYAPPGTAMLVAKIGGVYCTGGFYVDDADLTLIQS